MNKKMLEPIIIGGISIIVLAFCIYLLCWANSVDPLPTSIFVFMIGLLIVPIIGIIVNVVIRIKEIKGGEEDEASKY